MFYTVQIRFYLSIQYSEYIGITGLYSFLNLYFKVSLISDRFSLFLCSSEVGIYLLLLSLYSCTLTSLLYIIKVIQLDLITLNLYHFF